MKRKKQKNSYVAEAKNVRYWAFIHCTKEDTAIAISKIPVQVKQFFGQKNVDKVGPKQWAEGNAIFRDKDYVIDFKSIELGNKVTCPVCGGTVDFRLIPGDEMPGFGNAE